ncbi:hypothetical protein ACP70R_023436 [Stipagrostis hirtigluma subsp. patula]
MKSSLQSQQETRRVCDGVIIGAMLLSLYVLSIVKARYFTVPPNSAEDQLQEQMNCSTQMEAKGRRGQEEVRLCLLVDAATRATATLGGAATGWRGDVDGAAATRGDGWRRCGHGEARRHRRGGVAASMQRQGAAARSGSAASGGRHDGEARSSTRGSALVARQGGRREGSYDVT